MVEALISASKVTRVHSGLGLRLRMLQQYSCTERTLAETQKKRGSAPRPLAWLGSNTYLLMYVLHTVLCSSFYTNLLPVTYSQFSIYIDNIYFLALGRVPRLKNKSLLGSILQHFSATLYTNMFKLFMMLYCMCCKNIFEFELY